ncbi:adenylate/guanylate cyclase domain-containing protein [Pseudolysinimonas sp.]|uniref:adenylate/guanylate cyclase domain-containing protein n=1 Tax=Pseudolysinimonas sp. TaxID=2680009 RepID=UPI00286D29C6|nr:adenylate/guanylate cyclase domain-containing protein [Pseudolysinimonas sp.]
MTVDDAPGDHVAARVRRRHSLSIKSLLLLMLLLVSVGSNVVVGVIGYINGTESLTNAAEARLTEVRDSRAREILNLFDSIEASLLLASRDSAVVDAELAFSSAVAELDTAAIADDAVTAAGGVSEAVLTPEQEAELVAFFTDDFGPRLNEASGEEVDASSFIPASASARYLLYHYTVKGGDDASAVDDAGDGSTWSAAHAAHHDYLRRLARLSEYPGLVLISLSGQVVYSVNKDVDLGADLVDGPHSYSNLALAFQQAMSGNRLDSVTFADFEPYAPALDAPTGWAVAPLASDDAIVGAIGVRLPSERIDAIMTGGGDWQNSGLGVTGEAYLVGRDGTMRSLSRDLAQDPEAYLAAATAVGLPIGEAERAVETGQTLLIQRVDTKAAELALDGRSGIETSANYLGDQSIAAYAPVKPAGLEWAIIAEIDASEALAPVADFTSRLAISSAILVGIVSLISVFIAGFAVRPLYRLRDAARRIAAGETGVQVEAGESDELADVAAAFNEMSRSLELKNALLEEQRVENERLLRTLMPEAVAKRYREGARTIVQDHQEVTVLFADVVGFEEYGRGIDSEKSLDLLNEIFRAFDDAAEEHGVERVRSTRAGYLASCGLSVPRVDNARRAVAFSLDIARIVERFGAQQGADIHVRVGMDTGTVTSGLIGRTSMVYDLWGDAVSLAFRLQGGATESGVFLTQRVVDKIPDVLPYTDAGVVETASGWQRVWRVDPAATEL